MGIDTMLEEFIDWLGMLSPEFAFMLATPFIVAAAALLQRWIRRGGHRPERRRQTSPRTQDERRHAQQRWGNAV